jgi:hypothetical protein
MTFQQSNMTPAGAGDWVVDAMRRRPEAFLLMAAGCALLMRTGRRPVGSVAARMAMADQGPRRADGGSSRIGERLNEAGEAVAGYASEVADKVSGTTRAYASNVADTVTDYAETARRTVSGYADDARRTVSGYAEDARRTASGYAEDARRNLSETSDRLMGQAETTYRTASETIREQPILVAALGLAAGAAIAALFPATEVERRTLGVAREALADAAAETGENLMRAAGKAGDRLKEAAAERGLDAEGLTDMAKDVAASFTSAASGNAEPGSSPRSPQSAAIGSSASQTGTQSPAIGASASPSQRPQSPAVGSSASASRPSEPPRPTTTSAAPTKSGSVGNVPGRS